MANTVSLWQIPCKNNVSSPALLGHSWKTNWWTPGLEREKKYEYLLPTRQGIHVPKSEAKQIGRKKLGYHM